MSRRTRIILAGAIVLLCSCYALGMYQWFGFHRVGWMPLIELVVFSLAAALLAWLPKPGERHEGVAGPTLAAIGLWYALVGLAVWIEFWQLGREMDYLHLFVLLGHYVIACLLAGHTLSFLVVLGIGRIEKRPAPVAPATPPAG